MLLIPYYTTVFRGQSQNRWYKTAMSAAMLLNNILNLLASDIPFSTSRIRYSFVTLHVLFVFLFGDVKATYPVRQNLKDHSLHSLL